MFPKVQFNFTLQFSISSIFNVVYQQEYLFLFLIKNPDKNCQDFLLKINSENIIFLDYLKGINH